MELLDARGCPEDPTDKGFKDFGFVHQKDLFVTSLTVAEHLAFTAALKLKELTPCQRSSRLDEITRQMRLAGCRDTRISAISGGERRRLSFAAAALNRPSMPKYI